MPVDILRPGPAITRADIVHLEHDYGISLPRDYRDMLLRTNGGFWPDYVEVESADGELFYPRNLFSLDVGGVLDIRYQLGERMGYFFPKGTVPIGMDHYGNCFILGLSGDGPPGVYFWKHALEGDPDEPNMSPATFIVDSFQDFFSRIRCSPYPEA